MGKKLCLQHRDSELHQGCSGKMGNSCPLALVCESHVCSAQCWQQQFSIVFACLLLSESKMYYSLLLYTLHGVETKIRYELKVHQSLLTWKIDRDSKSSFFFLLFTHSSTTCCITQEELSCSDASQGVKTTIDTVIPSLAGLPVCCLPLTRYYWVVSQMVWMRPKGL